jgi:hypothetical protein
MNLHKLKSMPPAWVTRQFVAHDPRPQHGLYIVLNLHIDDVMIGQGSVGIFHITVGMIAMLNIVECPANHTVQVLVMDNKSHVTLLSNDYLSVMLSVRHDGCPK